jgi:hypothetical protein
LLGLKLCVSFFIFIVWNCFLCCLRSSFSTDSFFVQKDSLFHRWAALGISRRMTGRVSLAVLNFERNLWRKLIINKIETLEGLLIPILIVGIGGIVHGESVWVAIIGREHV